MEVDAKITAALIALSGIFITTLFGVIGYVFKLRQDRTKSSRTVLYLLLEIRHSLLKAVFNPVEAANKYIEHYDEKLKERGIEPTFEYQDEFSEFSEQMRQAVIEYFTNITNTQKTDIRRKLLEPYEEALNELATINPVLAHLLKGHENLEQILPHSETHLQNVQSISNAYVTEDNAQSLIKNSSNDIGSEAIEQLCNILEDNILLVAKSCSRKDHKRCQRLFERGLNLNNQYDFKGLDEAFDKALDKLFEEIKNRTEESQEQSGLQHATSS